MNIFQAIEKTHHEIGASPTDKSKADRQLYELSYCLTLLSGKVEELEQRITQPTIPSLSNEAQLTPRSFRNMAHCEKEYHRLKYLLLSIEHWLDGIRMERDRTRFEQRWNTLQDEAAELRVLVLRALGGTHDQSL